MPILLQKSKIERSQKSRESRFLGTSNAAKCCSSNTRTRGRFSAKRCGPSRREVRDASAALKISVHHPNNTFATKSALFGHGAMSDVSSKCAPERKSVRYCLWIVACGFCESAPWSPPSTNPTKAMPVYGPARVGVFPALVPAPKMPG